mgnify:CR=1 FL=1
MKEFSDDESAILVIDIVYNVDEEVLNAVVAELRTLGNSKLVKSRWIEACFQSGVACALKRLTTTKKESEIPKGPSAPAGTQLKGLLHGSRAYEHHEELLTIIPDCKPEDSNGFMLSHMFY